MSALGNSAEAVPTVFTLPIRDQLVPARGPKNSWPERNLGPGSSEGTRDLALSLQPDR